MASDMKYDLTIEHHLKPDREFWRAIVTEGIKPVDAYESDWKRRLKEMVLSSTKWKLTPSDWKRAEKYMVERN
jgi:hypothetical protein